MRPSIQAQLNAQGQNLDFWDEVVEKTVDAKAKASLQLLSKTREIDSKCLQGKQHFMVINENKLSNTLSVNIGSNQISDQMLNQMSDWLSDWSPIKKNSSFYQSFYQNSRQDSCYQRSDQSHKFSKDLSNITCFNFDLKGHYAI